MDAECVVGLPDGGRIGCDRLQRLADDFLGDLVREEVLASVATAREDGDLRGDTLASNRGAAP